ncbi:MAG TPA: glycosyltransferase family 4 protein [Roseiflexaceae bacterium]|nr:glycosyltransferase family 4 protein [Roseiflexaceae bacterium]
MKIVLPVHHFPPRFSAGAELYTLRLARGLQQHGHDVEVVAIDSIAEGRIGDLRAMHDTYQGVPVWRLSFNLLDAPERRRWDFDNPLLGDWFSGYLLRSRPDIVHFQAGYLLGVAPLRAVAAAGIPSVLTLHDYWFLCPRTTLLRGDGTLCQQVPDDPSGCVWCRCTEQRRYQLADRLTAGLAGQVARRLVLGEQTDIIAERREHLRAALALPAVLIAPSHFLARQFAPLSDPARLLVLRYGLDTARYRVHAPPPADGTLRIGYTGQIAPHKGVHLLVEAFRALRTASRPAELHIYGGLEPRPDYAAQLRRIARDDPRVLFHGRYDHEHLPAILSELDVTVTPSTWYENSPLAIMEAHAAGTPVITAALGGMAELVRDGIDGLHFTPGDAADLARQLQRLVDEPQFLRQLRAGVRPPRSAEDELTELLDIYDSVVAAAAPHPRSR